MRSAVTGGGGFLGSEIARQLLEKGDEVVVIGRRLYDEWKGKGALEFAVDIRKYQQIREALKGCDRVFHTAAKVGIWGNRKDFYETNVVGTQNIIKACRQNGISQLIYTSSPSVTFDGTEQRGIDESYPYPNEWLSFYPETKKIAEETVLWENGREGLYTVALRPHLIWGRGDKFLIPRVLEQARQKKLIRVGSGKNLVDIVHVKNAAEAHLLAAENIGPKGKCNGKAYFLSQGEPVVLWDFIADILERAKLPPVKKSISFKMAYNVGAALETAYRWSLSSQEPRMTRFLAHQLAKDHYYNITAAKSDFGYSPKVSTQQGLAELFS